MNAQFALGRFLLPPANPLIGWARVRWVLRAYAITLVLSVALHCVLLTPLWSMWLYNLILFHPTHDGNFSEKTFDGLPVQQVRIHTPQNTELFGWYIAKSGATKVALYSHGNGGNILWHKLMLRQLLAANMSVLTYDYDGFGLSTGKTADLEAAVADGVAAYDFLDKQKHFVPAQIVLAGQSLGTGVACQISRRRPCAGLILHSPFSSLIDIGKLKFGYMRLYPRCMFPEQMLESNEVLKKPHAPLLVLHGAEDQLIPISNAQLLVNESRAPKRFVVGAHSSHNFWDPNDCPVYQNAVSDFVSTLR